MNDRRNERQLAAARSVVEDLADSLDLNASVRLWDGSLVPLGHDVSAPLEVRIADAHVLSSLLHWPTLDNIIRHYITKKIDLVGGTLLDLAAPLIRRGRLPALGWREIAGLLAKLRPFLLQAGDRTGDRQAFHGDVRGRRRRPGDNAAFIQFHYDLSNDFYGLFLDREMVYSCAYFTDWANGIDQAQHDKLDMICRKLRLKPGDRLLDIGCGWGGLICHAAKHYGVEAHGITLSKRQIDYAKEKIGRLGLVDRVTVEMRDYGELQDGRYNKIASVGMYEHIGLANIPAYMQTVRRLLSDDGLFLNHAISRCADQPGWRSKRLRPEEKAIRKYIFPGGELDDIGHSLHAMEQAGFEVQDVEAWRRHYARTTRLWCERLTAARDRAVGFVGEEKYRIWVAYLAGVSLAFERGTLRIFQTLASRSADRPPPLPPTRADLYA